MKIIGHRGAKGLAPENTLESFKAAIEAGVDAVEFDVRVSRDGVALLNHNSDIGLPGRDLDIAKTNYKELKAAKPTLVTLEEAMKFLRGKSTVVLEIKWCRDVTPIIEVIKQQLKDGWRQQDIRISSFLPSYLKQIRKHFDKIEIVVNESWSSIHAILRARHLNTRHITMNQRWLWSGLIKNLTKRGYILSAYTINNADKAKRWTEAGLHAVITDHPDKIRG